MDRGPVPRAFVALTQHEYVLPFVSPERITIWTAGFWRTPLTVTPPFDDVHVALKRVKCEPLLLGVAIPIPICHGGGGTNDTGIPGLPGAPAIVRPVMSDDGPFPTPFLATTLNEYAFPLVNPVMDSAVAADANGRGGCATAPRYGVTM